MPITVTSGRSDRFACVTVTGSYTFDEWSAAISKALASSSYRQTGALLIDRRRSNPPTTELVDRMTRYIAEHEPDLRSSCIAIVASDDVGFGMARMTEMKAEHASPGTATRAFRDIDEAIGWLLSESSKRGQPQLG